MYSGAIMLVSTTNIGACGHHSRPSAIAASISFAVGINPPRNFTGFGSFGWRGLPVPSAVWSSSAITSLSFLCSWTARILTSCMSLSGRSRVVFISPYSQKAGFLSTSAQHQYWQAPWNGSLTARRVRFSADFADDADYKGGKEAVIWQRLSAKDP